MHPIPTESDAIEIAAGVLRRPVLRASRFPTGEGNFVFDVTMGDAAGVDRNSRLLDFYTAVLAVDFLAEVGHLFDTRDSARAAEPAYVARLIEVLGLVLSRLAP